MMKPFTYGSVCSGIEAATAAWHPLGWQPAFFSEIEPFHSAVLSHRHPNTPNLGDMTKFKDWPNYAIDLLVGGTPCQSFSVAGLRKGLADPRGNLALTFLAIVDRYRPRWVCWENVPGVHSSWSDAETFAASQESTAAIEQARRAVIATGIDLGADFSLGDFEEVDQSSDFDCFLAGLAELGYGVATRVLDAQYVRVESHPRAVPQRRRRVFVVGYLGDWRRAAAVLFERESLCGNPPPSRIARQGVAPTLSARTKGGGGLGTDFDLDGGVICAGTGQAGTGQAGTGQAGTEILRELCPTLNCNHEQPYIANTLLGKSNDSHAADLDTYVAHSLRGEGFDASEDGTGRGTPLVPVVTAFDCKAGANTGFAIGEVPGALRGEGHGGGHAAIAFDTTQITSKANRSNPQPDDACHPLAAEGHPPAIAFSCKDHGADAQEGVAPTMRAMGFDGSHANGGGQLAVAIQAGALRENPEGVAFNIHSQNSCAMTGAGPAKAALETSVARCLDGAGFTEQQGGTVALGPTRTAVRRLTPRECERLQGFPDDYTLIPIRGKPAADGPRYKALGNSMAVNVMSWIWERIQSVEALTKSDQ